MSEVESKEEARKMMTCLSAKPRRVRLVIGLFFTGAKLEAMTWGRTKGPINKEKTHSPKQSWQTKIWLKSDFDFSACAFAASICSSMIFLFLFLTQPLSNDSPISANFISVSSAKKSCPNSFAALHLAHSYSLVTIWYPHPGLKKWNNTKNQTVLPRKKGLGMRNRETY